MCVIINLKPKNEEAINLYKIQDIYGYSNSSWTPIMLRLKAIFVDVIAPSIDKNSFTEPVKPAIVHTFLYAKGSVKDNKIDGTWIAPPISATNSALLWPDALSYFVSVIHSNKDVAIKNLELANIV